MSCDGNNATAPSPAIAPGGASRAPAAELDPRRIAEDLATRFGEGGVDPRVRAFVPEFDGPFFQAGLAGYSDAAMRIIARRHGCPFCVTEALLDRTLLAGGRGFAKADLGEIEGNVPGGDEDHPLSGQIMGSEPAEMAAAAVKMVEQGRRAAKDYRDIAYTDGATYAARAMEGRIRERPAFARVKESTGATSPMADGQSPIAPAEQTFATIDVNLACPVKKIAKASRGGHWLAQPEGAIKILEAVREAVPADIAVTVKMRRAFDDTEEMRERFLKVFDAAYDIGCAWVTVHGRTVEQKYVGPSRWDPLRELVERSPERVIFGSGDVWDVGAIFRMLAYAGVQAVSVARGCIGNPWIFRQARDLLAGREPAAPTIAEQRGVLEEHFRLALAVNHWTRDPELHTGKTMRKFGIRFAAHHPHADTVRERFIRVRSLDEWHAVLDEHYATDQPR